MDDQLYNAAWDVVEPIMEEYLTLSGRFQIPQPATQADYNQVLAAYVVVRDAALAPLGVTFDQISEESGRRLDAIRRGSLSQIA